MKQRGEFESRGATNGITLKYKHWFYIAGFFIVLVGSVIAHEDRYTLASETKVIKEQVKEIDNKQEKLEKDYLGQITEINTHLVYIKDAIKKLEK